MFIQTTTEMDLNYWHQVLLQFITYAPESEANFHFPHGNIVKDLKLANELIWCPARVQQKPSLIQAGGVGVEDGGSRHWLDQAEVTEAVTHRD